MKLRRRQIKCAIIGAMLGLVGFTGAVIVHFVVHPLGIACLWDGGPYWIYEDPQGFNRMLAERFPTEPQKQDQVRLLYYEYGVLEWLSLYGGAVAVKLPFVAFIGASFALALEQFRQNRLSPQNILPETSKIGVNSENTPTSAS